MYAYRTQGRFKGNFDQNIGVPGVVYVLKNTGFRDNYWKIGSTRHSGAVRASQLNQEAGTAIPATFACVFEKAVCDCGTAERMVHARMRGFRRGRHGNRNGKDWGQEFFEVELEVAKETIRQACEEVERRNNEALRIKGQETAAGEGGKAGCEPPGQATGEGKDIGLYERVEQAPRWTRPGKADEELPRKLGTAVVALAGMIALVATYGRHTTPSGSAERYARTKVASQENGSPPGRNTQRKNIAESALVIESDTQRSGSIPFPKTGWAIYPNGAPEQREIEASLKIQAPTSSMNHHVVVLATLPENRVFAQVFLESNDVVEIGLRAGTYRALFARGMEWFGQNDMFGREHPVRQLGGAFEVRAGARLNLALPE